MTAEDEAFDELAKRQGDWGGGFKAKQGMAMHKTQDQNICRHYKQWQHCHICDLESQVAELASIKAILDEYGLQAIDFVADFKAALAQPAQPAQETVAMYGHCPICGAKGVSRERRLNGNDLCESGHIYPSRDSTTPPKRKWVGLTNEEIEAIYLQHHNQYCECESPNWGYERAIEAKLKEKNFDLPRLQRVDSRARDQAQV